MAKADISCPRDRSEDDLVEVLAARFLDVRDSIVSGGIDPFAIAAKIKTFTPATQLSRVYRMHHDIQRNDLSARVSSVQSAAG